MSHPHLHFTPPLPPFHSTRLVVAATFRAARHAWRQARAQRRQAARARDALIELHEMDDRMLADIGIRRCELPAVSRGKAFDRLPDDAAAWSPQQNPLARS